MRKTPRPVVIASMSMVVVAVPAFLWLAWQTGHFPDWGLESGYYGRFSRVKHTIERMPGVRIVDCRMHRDVTLEDFGFVLALADGGTVRVDFTEGSPQMAERRKAKVRGSVERQIASES